MFGNVECPIHYEMGTEQNRHVFRTAVFADLLRGIDRHFDEIIHHVP